MSESSRPPNRDGQVTSRQCDEHDDVFCGATAIVLAGGLSSRMGRDKALLDIDGVTLIERIVAQLKSVFSEIIISARTRNDYAFLGLRVVPDRVPGQGPLMAIASSLEASSSEYNFVVSCDIPSLPIDLVRELFYEAKNGDGAVAITSDGKYEPLFAVYRKSMALAAQDALRGGNRRVVAMYQNRAIRPVRMKSGVALKNINTPADYSGYLSGA